MDPYSFTQVKDDEWYNGFDNDFAIIISLEDGKYVVYEGEFGQFYDEYETLEQAVKGSEGIT